MVGRFPTPGFLLPNDRQPVRRAAPLGRLPFALPPTPGFLLPSGGPPVRPTPTPPPRSGPPVRPVPTPPPRLPNPLGLGPGVAPVQGPTPPVVAQPTPPPSGGAGFPLSIEERRRQTEQEARFYETHGLGQVRPPPDPTSPLARGEGPRTPPGRTALQAEYGPSVLPLAEADRDAARTEYEAANAEYNVALSRIGGQPAEVMEGYVREALTLALGQKPTPEEVGAEMNRLLLAPPPTQEAVRATGERRDAALGRYYGADAAVVYWGGTSAGDLGGGVVNGLFWLLDAGRQAVATQLGGVAHSIATGGEIGPAVEAAAALMSQIPGGNRGAADGLATWASENRAYVNDLYANGYDADGDGQADYTGDRAIWEAWVHTQPTFVRAVADVAIDPLSYLTVLSRGGSAVARAGQTLRTPAAGATGVTRRADLLGRAAEATGTALQVPAAVLDRPVDEAAAWLWRQGPGRLGPVFRQTDRAKTEQKLGDLATESGGVVARPASPAPLPPPTQPAATTPPLLGPGGQPIVPPPNQPPPTVLGPTGQPVSAAPAQPPPTPPPPAAPVTPRPTPQPPQPPPVPVPARTVPESWRLTPPPDPAGLAAMPWPVRPQVIRGGRGNVRLGALARERPEAWPRVMHEIGDEAAATERRMSALQRTDPTRVSEVFEEARWDARVDSAIARHAPDLPPQPVELKRQPGMSGGYGRAVEAPAPRVERVIRSDWAATNRDRQWLYGFGDSPDGRRWLAPEPPSAATREAVVEGRFPGRRTGRLPHTNLRIEDLADVPAPRRAQAADQWFAGETEAHARYREAVDLHERLTGDPVPVREESAARPEQLPLGTATAAPAPSAETVPTVPTVPANPLMPEYATVPFEAIRTTRQLGEAADFQNRRADFSEKTAASVHRALRDDPGEFTRLYTAIEVARRPDGTLVVVSGHSRHEGIRRAIADGSVPHGFPTAVKFVPGTPEQVAEAATVSNLTGTPNTPSEIGRILRRFAEADGLTPGEVLKAREIKGVASQAQAERLVEITYLPDDVQGMVDQGLVSEPHGAKLGRAIRTGLIEPADAQQIAVDVLATMDLSPTQLEHFVVGAADRAKALPGGPEQGSLFDLGTVEKRSVVEAIIDLGRELSQQTGLQRSVARVAKSDLPSAAAARADLETVKTRVNDLRAKLGYAPLRLLGANPAQTARDLPGVRFFNRQVPGRAPGPATTRLGRGVEWLTRAEPPPPTTSDAPVTRWRDRVVAASEETALAWVPRSQHGRAAGDVVSEWMDRAMKADPALSEQDALVASLRRLHKEEMEAIPDVLPGWVSPAIAFFDAAIGAARRLQILNVATGVRYVMTQLLGNAWTATLTRHPEIVGTAVREIPAAWRFVRDDAGIYEHADDLVRGAGLVRPTLLTRSPRDEVGLVTANGKRQTAQRLGLDWQSPARLIAPKWLRDAALTMDFAFRVALWDQEFGRVLPEVAGRFADDAATRAGRFGADEAAVRAAATAMGDAPDLAAMRTAMEAAASSLGPQRARAFADLVERDWVAAARQASEGAATEVRRVYFDGLETNADAFVRRLFFFHYWNSRASVLYAKELIRNPVLLNAWARGMAELEETAEEQGWPDWLKGWVKAGNTPWGFATFLHPMGLLATSFLFAEGDDERAWYNPAKYLMLNPLVDIAMYAVGEDGFREVLTGRDELLAPQLPGVGALGRLATAAVNLTRAEGSDESVLFDPTKGWVPALRRGVTDVLGIEAETPDPFASDRGTFNSLVIDAGRERGYTDEQIARAMDDPSDPAYQQAMDDWSRQRGTEAGVRAAVPIPTASRGVTRDELLAEERSRPPAPAGPGGALALPTDAAAPGGPSPEREGRMDLLQATRATGATERALEMQVGDRADVGSERGQYANRRWAQVAYGPLTGRVVVDGVAYTEDDLAAIEAELTPTLGAEGAAAFVQGIRFDLADAWVTESGLAGERAELQTARDAYDAAHPEYRVYRGWGDAVRGHPGGVLGWWQEAITLSPEARAFYDEAIAEGATGDDLERRLSGPAAYLATEGFTLPGAGGGTASAGAQPAWTDPANRAADVYQDIADYRSATALLEQTLGGPYPYWNPWLATIADQRIAAAGIDPAALELGQTAQDYLWWAATQPAGAPAAIPDFLIQRQSQDTGNLGLLPWLQGGQGSGDPRAMAMDVLPSVIERGGDPYADFRIRRGGGGSSRIGR